MDLRPPVNNAWPEAATADGLLVGTVPGTFYAVNAEGEATATLERETIFDALGLNGTIFVGDGRGQLLALDLWSLVAITNPKIPPSGIVSWVLTRFDIRAWAQFAPTGRTTRINQSSVYYSPDCSASVRINASRLGTFLVRYPGGARDRRHRNLVC
jgi:hypothetical protein